MYFSLHAFTGIIIVLHSPSFCIDILQALLTVLIIIMLLLFYHYYDVTISHANQQAWITTTTTMGGVTRGVRHLTSHWFFSKNHTSHIHFLAKSHISIFSYIFCLHLTSHKIWTNISHLETFFYLQRSIKSQESNKYPHDSHKQQFGVI